VIRSACLMALFWLGGTVPAVAASLTLMPGDSVVGEVQTVIARYEDTLSDLGRRFGVGYEEMVAANPGLDPWLPGQGTRILIPTRFVLPDTPYSGLVINLPEHRIYYYSPSKPGQPLQVRTYPISVGKMDWTTPLGVTRIVDKRVRPSWSPPESVRQEHEADGRPLPKVVPPGPDNPLGEYAMRLGIPGGAYLIHGTNKPIAVGMPVTHGCIRMFPEDIEELFKLVAVGTPVRIVDQAYKAGWQGDVLYAEVHRQNEGGAAATLTDMTKVLVAATRERSAKVDWDNAERVFLSANGVPEAINVDAAAPRTAAAH
jgi:L,D-transpeptidase ErfK/SrfK